MSLTAVQISFYYLAHEPLDSNSRVDCCKPAQAHVFDRRRRQARAAKKSRDTTACFRRKLAAQRVNHGARRIVLIIEPDPV
ncbi:MAG TPA: hypothetical protein VH351_10810 [Bryobacteraceae bacterium]|jgi:hypothetical protein|nr:hypothetical protein [Bryobacteraceae bacterium]